MFTSFNDWPLFLVFVFSLFLFRYLLIPGLAYRALWTRKNHKWSRRKIQPGDVDRRVVRAEFAWSIVSLFIFSFVALGVFFLFHHGHTRIYANIDDYGWGYLVLSVVLMILVHDTYFYWIHRLMHWGPLYRSVHSVHHRFTNPTPWCSFAFHPVEAILEVGIVPLVVLLMPAHPLAISAFLLIMTMINVMGHLGFEIFPSSYIVRWPTRLTNTATHHNQHHQFGRCNFGIYFNFWDSVMGTNHPEYYATFCRVSKR